MYMTNSKRFTAIPRIPRNCDRRLEIGQGEQAAALVVPAYARGESRRAIEDNLRTHFEKVGAGLSPRKHIRILRFTDASFRALARARSYALRS